MRWRPLVLIAALFALTVGVAPAVAAATLGTPEGFGGRVTGGEGGETRWVTSLADEGPGTLRDALERRGRAWVQFRVSGRIKLSRAIVVTSDKTVDARDADITLTGNGLRVVNATNVAIVNLAFTGGRGDTTDAISVREGATGVWVDHCEFSDYDDGLVDITRGATAVTVSWSRFTGQDKVMLVNAENETKRTQVTVHHNLFEDTNQRHPRVVGNVELHAYNNLLRRWTGYGMQAAADGTLLSEANIFEAGVDKDAIKSGGFVRSRNDLLLNGARVTSAQSNVDLHEPADYRAGIEAADLALQNRLLERAGRVGTSVAGAPAVAEPGSAVTEPSPSKTSEPPRLDEQASRPNRSDRSEGRGPAALVAGALVVSVLAVWLLRHRRRPAPPGDRPR